MKNIFKRFCSTITALTILASICVFSVSANETVTVTVPVASGQSHTWEAEKYTDNVTGEQNGTIEVITKTYEVSTDTEHLASKASDGELLQDWQVETSAETPAKIEFPIYVAQTTEYELEVVAAGGNDVFLKNYVALDGDKIFQLNTNITNSTVTAEKLGWKSKTGTNSNYYEAIKYTKKITIPAGNHTLAFVIPLRTGGSYGAFMLDYIKLTSYGAPGTVAVPIAPGQSHTWEAEDYNGKVTGEQAGNTVEVVEKTYDVQTDEEHIEPKSSRGGLLQDWKVETSNETPAKIEFPIYVSQTTEYELEVVAAGGNTVFQTNYVALDGDKIFQLNTTTTNTIVTAEKLGWKSKTGTNSKYYEAIKYTKKITIPAGDHTLAFVIPFRSGADYGTFMLDYVKLTSCNEAGISFDEAEITAETTSVTANAYYANRDDDRVTLYVALYDESGSLLKVESAFSTEGAGYLTKTVTLVANTHTAKAFLWGDELEPIFDADSVSKNSQ